MSEEGTDSSCIAINIGMTLPESTPWIMAISLDSFYGYISVLCSFPIICYRSGKLNVISITQHASYLTLRNFDGNIIKDHLETPIFNE